MLQYVFNFIASFIWINKSDYNNDNTMPLKLDSSLVNKKASNKKTERRGFYPENKFKLLYTYNRPNSIF